MGVDRLEYLARQPDWGTTSAFNLRIERFDEFVQLAPRRYGVTLSISIRKRSRRVSFFLAAYSRAEKLFGMMDRWQ